jgi:hypothetical protein
MTRATESSGKIAALPRMTVAETVAVLAWAGGPLVAKGIIVRRPWVVALLQATGLERQGISVLQDLRRRYGEGPVLMRLPWREQAIVLSPDHLRRVLDGTPAPFQTDSSEKHATLAHFEPEGSLISRGPIDRNGGCSTSRRCRANARCMASRRASAPSSTRRSQH